ncbi:MAG: photosystem II biogenesis protein Psp29 [Alkalinema sp. RU_4_3]|nr:photosystem II biogenesis protein Psp29 [Alkalinema sp. RU_4_3]
MNNSVRTVSDAKRAFYGTHTRPINSIYRRVVEELMVEMHLLSVHQNFVYDALYALGITTTFDRFMQSYRPESDVAPIFSALCSSVGLDSAKVRSDSERLLGALAGASWEGLLKGDVSGELGTVMGQVQNNPNFKYSRLFAIGAYRVMEEIDADALKDNEKFKTAVEAVATTLKLIPDKVQKDLELYRGNLDKLNAAAVAIADTIAADRKKRAEREQERAAAAEKAEKKDETTAV